MAEFYRSKLLEKFERCLHAVTIRDNELPYHGSLALHTGEAEKKIISNREAVMKWGEDVARHFYEYDRTPLMH